MSKAKVKQLENEIKRIAAIEDAFKELGKVLYYGYMGGYHKVYFYSVMDEFHERLTKLKEKQKCK